MKKRIITNQTIKSFEKYLIENEKAEATIQKYMHDIRGNKTTSPRKPC